MKPPCIPSGYCKTNRIVRGQFQFWYFKKRNGFQTILKIFWSEKLSLKIEISPFLKAFRLLEGEISFHLIATGVMPKDCSKSDQSRGAVMLSPVAY